ncbi:MAG TPA: ABC transporter permease subunit [Kofleriaceae bacterium]|nr:ABC transporter permease subunit [Kofleriaceae bacterium]
MATRVLGGGAATIAIARVSFTRAMRTRTLYGAAGVAALPIVMASIFTALKQHEWRSVVEMNVFTSAVLSALLVAGLIGEEFEDKTMTYLWSRPLPRWSVITGKLLALVPMAAAIAAAGVAIALNVALGDDKAPLGRVAIAIAAGTTARAAIAAAWATLVPKQSVALTIAYLFFFDFPLAVIPARLQAVSLAFHEAQIAGTVHDESVTSAIIGLCAISAVWLGVALWRVRRIE